MILIVTALSILSTIFHNIKYSDHNFLTELEFADICTYFYIIYNFWLTVRFRIFLFYFHFVIIENNV